MSNTKVNIAKDVSYLKELETSVSETTVPKNMVRYTDLEIEGNDRPNRAYREMLSVINVGAKLNPRKGRCRILEEYLSLVAYTKVFVLVEINDNEVTLQYREVLAEKGLSCTIKFEEAPTIDILLKRTEFIGWLRNTVVALNLIPNTENTYRDNKLEAAFTRYRELNNIKSKKQLLKLINKYSKKQFTNFIIKFLTIDNLGLFNITLLSNKPVHIDLSYIMFDDGTMGFDVGKLFKNTGDRNE